MRSAGLTDEVFRALGDPLRREILCLMDAKEESTVDTDQMCDLLTTMYDTSEQRVTTALEHNHLPRLRDVGLIDYDERSGVIRYDEKELVAVLRKHGLIECKTCSDDCETPEIPQQE